MLNAAVTSAALDRLAESPARRMVYWSGSYTLMVACPLVVAGLLTGSNPWAIVAAGLVGFAAWVYWTNRIRTRMRHLKEAVPSDSLD